MTYDPYAAASRFSTLTNDLGSNRLRWLWVPAFAGTTRVWGATPLHNRSSYSAKAEYPVRRGLSV